MSKKLTPDEIKWVLSLDSGGAQKSIAELAKENKNLERANKETRKEMKELEAQGKKNSAEYLASKASIEENTKAIDKNKSMMSELEKTLKVGDMTMTQLRRTAKNLQSQLDTTAQSTNPDEYKALEDQLNAVKGRMSELRGSTDSMQDIMIGLPGPLGAAAGGVSGLNKAMMTLYANPVFLVLGGLALIIMGIVKAVNSFSNSSEEAGARSAKAMAPIKVLLAKLGDAWEWVGEKIMYVIEGASTMFQQLVSFANEKFGLFDDLNDKLIRQNQIEEDSYKIQQRRKEMVVEQKQAESDLLAIRLKLQQKDKYSAEERKKFVDEYLAKENEIFKKKEDLAKMELELEQNKAAQDDNSYEDNMRLKELEANVIQAQVDSTRNLSELEEKRIGLLAEISGKQKAAATDAKKDIDTRTKAVDANIKKEQLLLKQQYANGEITKIDYLKRMEDLELQSLNRKLKIYGLDAEKRMQFEDKVLDYKIKMLEQYKDIQLNGIMTKSEKEKDDPEKKKITNQKKINKELQNLYKKNVADQKASYKEQEDAINKYQGVVSGAADAFGNVLGGFIAGSEEATANFQYNMLMLGLNTLQQMIVLASAEILTNETKRLGVIAGPIAAAAGMAVINGVFEGIKGSIKRPSVNGGSGSNDVNGGPRSGTVGYAEGGYTGDGGKYDVAGVVHRGEYVVPAWAVKSPVVFEHIQAIETVRRSRTSSNPMPGYADGGYVTPIDASGSDQNNAVLQESIRTNKALITVLKRIDRRGVGVNYSNLEAAEKRVINIRAKASKKRRA